MLGNTKCYIRIIGALSLIFTMGFWSASAQMNDQGATTYDVIYLKNGQVLKGEILIFEEADGDITFIDTQGKKYSLTRQDYKFFIENQTFKTHNKDKIIYPRKDNEAAFYFGFSAPMLNVVQNLHPDAYYVNGVESQTFLPVSVKASAGHYYGSKNYVGFTGEVALISDVKNFYSVGGRYCYHYNGHKNNVSLYLPFEVQYQYMRIQSYYQVADTAFYMNGSGYTYPSDKNIGTTFSSVALSVGQGVSFIKADKRSVSIELAIVKNFILATKYKGLTKHNPDNDFNMYGIKLSLLWGLY